ncbi:hypothetical protein L7F22_055281 [Adiantum nelumboides]|nr:hypothetical protein [Adiantum nelumboides]
MKKEVRIDSYVDVTPQDENSLMCAVAQQPVSVAINAGVLDFQLYADGVFSGTCSDDPNDVDHAVLIVGYGSEYGRDYWIVKNSCSESWVSSFKMVPLAEQIEKYCCGLPKGIKKYCTKTSVMNMAQLMENAEVADDLIQGKPDEHGSKTRRKEPQGRQFSAKGNVTSRLTVPPFKKNPFARSKPFEGNRPFNSRNRPNAENQQFRPPPFSRQR